MRIDGKKSADYVKTFTEMWLSCGLACRKGSSWIKREDLPNFTDEMERRGACLHYIHRRAKAHWQSGILERQGQWLRNIWEKMMDHEVMDIEDVDYALAETCHAKNTLRRSHGYSPAQWVFGGKVRLGDCLVEDDLMVAQREELNTPSEEFRRKQEIRMKAREALPEVPSRRSYEEGTTWKTTCAARRLRAW